MAMGPSDHTRSLSTVYHVGDLSGDRERPHISYEGAGVSVSHHLEVWRDIVRKTGDSEIVATATTYELSTENATFYDAVPGGPPRASVVGWALANGFVQETDGFEVRWVQGGEHHMMQVLDRDRAEREATIEGRELHEVTLLALDQCGERY